LICKSGTGISWGHFPGPPPNSFNDKTEGKFPSGSSINNSERIFKYIWIILSDNILFYLNTLPELLIDEPDGNFPSVLSLKELGGGPGEGPQLIPTPLLQINHV